MADLARDTPGRQAGHPVARRRVRVTGLVQGVGFRPYVYRLASDLCLAGWVLNSATGVLAEVEGAPSAVEAFVGRLVQNPPPLARIDRVEVTDVEPAGETGFVIRTSAADGPARTLCPPDVALCPACRAEVSDPSDRRYGYPFTNCTDCGPRYTIIRELPYDRPLTSMASFQMCPACRREYEDPRDRRFHAQPNACPACGPKVWVEDLEGRILCPPEAGSVVWAAEVRRLLREGAVVAVKGIGGLHLACDACSEEAVARLRERKRRPAKPLAVMAPDLHAAARHVEVGPEAARLLTSPAAPVVILPRRDPPAGKRRAAEGLAPGSPTLGVMLAYTPLHLALFEDGLDLLVMTSANRSGLPIVRDAETARRDLRGIADFLVLHDRDIVNRCEDSVLRLVEVPSGVKSEPPLLIPVRRSRGYAPSPLDVGPSLPPARDKTPAVTLAAGAEMKNTFCLLRGSEAFPSPHIGEMDSVETLEAYRETLARYSVLLGVRPDVIAYDPHPRYLVSREASHLAAKGPGHTARLVPVWHHHAHLVSCLADAGLPGDEEVIGLVCDGTGLGPDGTIWGAEVLLATACSFRRLGHLVPVPLPGGDLTARRPARSAAAHLYRSLGPDGPSRLVRLRPEVRREIEAVTALLTAPDAAGAPLASSSGRLFDAVAALAGLAEENTYEGQAAVALGDLLESGTDLFAEELPERYRFRLSEAAEAEGGSWVFDPSPFWRAALDDVEAGCSAALVSLRFHQAFAGALVEAATRAASETGVRRLVLSGGTFQNVVLVRSIRRALVRRGVEVFLHRRVPPNDGGLSLGQAVAAAWMTRGGVRDAS